MANSTGAPVQLPVWDTITTAWEKVYGSKGVFMAAIGMIFVISIVFGILEGLTKENIPPVYSLLCFISNLVGMLLQFGLVYMGIRRAMNMSIEWKIVFRALTDLKLAFWLIVSYIAIIVVYIPAAIIAMIGAALMPVSMFLSIICWIAAFIVLMIIAMRVILTPAFVLDKDMNAWDAIKSSFRATRGNAVNIFAILVLQMLIVVISAIPLGIGLIWTIPLCLIIFGTMYQRLLPNLA